MSPLENPTQVERLARKLLSAVEDTGRLARRLQGGAEWSEGQLEDLKTASALLSQAQHLLRRHARRWRHWPLGGDE